MPARAENNLPALYNENKSEHRDVSERDIFYKVLIDLKKDVSELRKVVFGMIDNNELSQEFVEDNKATITRILSSEEKPTETSSFSTSASGEEDVFDHVVIEDRDTVSENEVLSLEAKEEELIRKALLKNNGRRKKAATELGISERTLYRKIKQYGIDK